MSGCVVQTALNGDTSHHLINEQMKRSTQLQLTNLLAIHRHSPNEQYEVTSTDYPQIHNIDIMIYSGSTSNQTMDRVLPKSALMLVN